MPCHARCTILYLTDTFTNRNSLLSDLWYLDPLRSFTKHHHHHHHLHTNGPEPISSLLLSSPSDTDSASALTFGVWVPDYIYSYAHDPSAQRSDLLKSYRLQIIDRSQPLDHNLSLSCRVFGRGKCKFESDWPGLSKVDKTVRLDASDNLDLCSTIP